jgi:hypothetical protein
MLHMLQMDTIDFKRFPENDGNSLRHDLQHGGSIKLALPQYGKALRRQPLPVRISGAAPPGSSVFPSREIQTETAPDFGGGFVDAV